MTPHENTIRAAELFRAAQEALRALALAFDADQAMLMTDRQQSEAHYHTNRALGCLNRAGTQLGRIADRRAGSEAIPE